MFNKILGSLIGLIKFIYIYFVEIKESIYAFLITVLFAYLLLKYFIKAGRDLNRINSISNSPIWSNYPENYPSEIHDNENNQEY